MIQRNMAIIHNAGVHCQASSPNTRVFLSGRSPPPTPPMINERAEWNGYQMLMSITRLGLHSPANHNTRRYSSSYRLWSFVCVSSSVACSLQLNEWMNTCIYIAPVKQKSSEALVVSSARKLQDPLRKTLTMIFAVLSYIMKIMFYILCYPNETTMVMNWDADAMYVG